MHTFSLLDKLLTHLDHALKTLSQVPTGTRPNPAANIQEQALNDQARQESIRLMRVNHAGEIAAQALYEGQALFARNPEVQENLQTAASEESDHLDWCRARLHELGGDTSYLNPLWYVGSFSIGALAGLFGDAVSLGFLAETEHQVTQHLNGHLQKISAADLKSQAILLRMRDDEEHHAKTAEIHGAMALPTPVTVLMKWTSQVMTRTAYWV